MPITLQDIEQAAERIRSGIINTRFEKSATLSSIFGTELYLKFENLQFTASFKERGALNKLLMLSEEERKMGVIAMSAGNHAKAIAYHAQQLNIPTTIVMPKNTPNVKVEDTRSFAATVILQGDNLDQAATHAQQLAKAEGLVFVHPFDDELIMAGQGTMVLEMLSDMPTLDTIVVPLGGGGLIAGVATAAKAIKPGIRIIGVEVESYPGAHDALRGTQSHGREKGGGATIAEGIAVKQPGPLALEVIRRLVDDIIVVEEAVIEEAINLLISIEKTITEGAGAAPLAAVMANRDAFEAQRTALVLTGANIDSRILASVLMRQLVRKGLIVRFLIKLDDSPGSLSEVSATIGDLGGNILEVSHQRMFSSVPIKEADLFLTVEIRDATQGDEILKGLQNLDYRAELIASN